MEKEKEKIDCFIRKLKKRQRDNKMNRRRKREEGDDTFVQSLMVRNPSYPPKVFILNDV